MLWNIRRWGDFVKLRRKTYRHLGLIYLPPIYCSKGQPVSFTTTVSFYTTILRNIQLIQSTRFQYFSLLPPFTFRCTRYYTCCLEMCKLYKFDSQDDYEYRSEGPNGTTLWKLCVHLFCCNKCRQRLTAIINPLNPELNPICYLLALLGAHHFLHVSRIRVKLLTLRRRMLYIYIWSTHSWCF